MHAALKMTVLTSFAFGLATAGLTGCAATAGQATAALHVVTPLTAPASFTPG